MGIMNVRRHLGVTKFFVSGIAVVVTVFIITVGVTGCRSGAQTSSFLSENLQYQSDKNGYIEQEILLNQIIKDMTLEEKVSQMIIPAFRTWNDVDVTDINDFPEIKEALTRHPYGGIILFGWNITGTEQTVRLLHELQKNNLRVSGVSRHIPYLTLIDEEGGRVVRLKSGTRLTGNMALGATREPLKNAELSGEIISREIASLGFNVNLAPVIDINNNPANPVIGIRSFSDNPETVAKLGVSYARGLQKNNVIATFKHYPGHGDTMTDSHVGMPSVARNYEDFLKNELIPYSLAVENGAEMIMTAHITYPLIDDLYTYGDGVTRGYYPATMSSKMINGILRKKLGYNGVVMSDALEMDPIILTGLVPGSVGSVEYHVNIAEKVIGAGVDILLLPADIKDPEAIKFYDEYIAGISRKVADGSISEERINESVRRILRLKIRHNILSAAVLEHGGDTPDVMKSIRHALQTVGSREHHESEWRMAGEAVTLLKNQDNILPLSSSIKNVVILGRYRKDEVTWRYAVDRLRKEGFIGDHTCIHIEYYLDSESGDEVKLRYTEEMRRRIAEADAVIGFSYASNADVLDRENLQYQALHMAMHDVHSARGRFILISGYLPYDAALYNDADAVVLTYMGTGLEFDPAEFKGVNRERTSWNANVVAAVEKIFGGSEFTGKLPVNIPVIKKNDDGSLYYGSEYMYRREQ